MNQISILHPIRRGLLPALAAACALASLPATAADDIASQMLLGKQVFTQQCAVCHTLKDAAAEGAVGPILDELKPDSARVAKALRDGLGNMPSYKTILSAEQIAALARYVSTASGGEK